MFLHNKVQRMLLAEQMPQLSLLMCMVGRPENLPLEDRKIASLHYLLIILRPILMFRKVARRASYDKYSSLDIRINGYTCTIHTGITRIG